MTLLACRRIGFGTLFTLGACALLASVPAEASAKSCEQDDDCPDEFTCEVTGAIECSDSKPCPEGEACETPADCVPEEYRECVSPSCEDDGDCPSDMVCYEQTSSQCGGSTPGCDPSGECPEPVDAGQPECTETTERSCVARYVPPCTEDTDCGVGFTCEEESISTCSGGGSAGGTGTGGAAPSMDGGQANPPDGETHCTTMPTGRFRCILQPVACDDESDCPSGFSCEDDPNQPACAVLDPAFGGQDDPEGSSEDGNCPDASTSPTKVCLPPYYDLEGGEGRGEQGGSTDGSGAENPPTTPRTHENESSGCSAAPGNADAPSALLALMCLALGIRSRRRHAR